MREDVIVIFRQLLLAWGKENFQPFPWRNIDDPYLVLLSEFLLHRTQARQVIPIYEKLAILYPDLASFCTADKDTVRQLLNPLGLGWRIDGLIDTFHEIYETSGRVPADYDTLISYRTIGPYIAGATVCFSSNKPVELVDVNIVRVTGRVFGLSLEGEARRRKPMIAAIEAACDPDSPRAYYYAVIDLAHKLCRPSTPLCQDCPLRQLPCAYYSQMNLI